MRQPDSSTGTDPTPARSPRWVTGAILGGLVALGLLAALVLTQVEVLQADEEPTTLLLSGRAVVPAGQVHDAVLVGRGTAVVAGEVEGDVLVLDGQARIEGVVRGTVTVLRGDAVLGPEAVVGGDVRTSSTSQVAAEAVVGGDTTTIGLGDLVDLLPLPFWLGLWASAGLAVLVGALVAPTPIQRTARGARRHPLRAAVLGGALLLVAPVVVAVLLASLAGAVVAVVLAAALVVGLAAGAAVTTAVVGRLALPQAGRLPLLVGWLLVGVVTALVLLVSPVAALVVAGALATFGLGALLVPTGGPDEDEATATAPSAVADRSWSRPDEVAAGASPDPDQPRVIAALPILDGAERRESSS